MPETRITYTLSVTLHEELRSESEHGVFSPRAFGWTLSVGTKDELPNRVRDALRLFVEGFPKTPSGMIALKEYLTSQEINHSVAVEESTVISPYPPLQYREQGIVTSGKAGTLVALPIGELGRA